jgi:hypothetical protein
MAAQKDDYYPLTLGELAKKLGRPGKHEVRRLRRFFLDREKTLGTEIMTRKRVGARTTYRVTLASLRRACPQFFETDESADPIATRRIAQEVAQEYFEEHIAPRLRVFDERDEAILGALHELTRECQLRPIRDNEAT